MRQQDCNELKTERLDLRPICLTPTFKFANYLFDLISNNRDFFKYMPWIDIETPEQEYEFLLSASQNWKTQKTATYGMYLSNTDEFVGCCSVMNINIKNCSCEIGYWLNPKYSRQGFMTEAVNAVTKEYYDRGANRIVIRANPENTGSCNVAKRCGFVYEGVSKQVEYNPATKNFEDLAVFAKLKEN
ncbi:MAG: GNAT family N-acetyltransferase [Alphaproteobacteria bacterium]|nr:GNAT family N-acetyltransferase [Alphaproteobacteria bacterium]